VPPCDKSAMTVESPACHPRLAAAIAWLMALVLTGCSAADAPPPPPGYKARAIAELGVAAPWGAAELVPGEVNTDGWEDSAYISPDGGTLYLQYFSGDMFRLEEMFKYHRPKAEGGLGADPAQRQRYHKGPPRGVSPEYTSDVLVFKREGDEFRSPKRFAHSRDGRNEWGVMLGNDGAAYYVSHDPTRAMNMDLYRNEQRLPIPGRDQYNEDNPHFVAGVHGRELFFDSGNRPQSQGKSHLWLTRESGGQWSEPWMLPAPINLPGSTEVQAHVAADGSLYFTSSRDDTISIYAAPRSGLQSWGEPRKLVWPTRKSGARVWGVGEPTLTADGQWMYFVVVFDDGAQRFDADVARVRRLPPR
jgi:WD40-like Beta Propeller Repeat